MDWIKIPTDSILYSEFKDSELITIIKYQALYCQLEREPSEAQMNRIFNKKELKLLQSYAEVVKELCKNQIFSVSKKRNKDKENYKQKQSISKNSASGTNTKRARNVEADKIREDNIKNNNLTVITKSLKKIVPVDWQPKDTTLAKLKEKGLDATKVVEKFINSCLAKNLKYVDFDRAVLSWDWSRDESLKAVDEEKCWF